MCRLRNIAMGDYQESVTTGQTNARQSDTHVQATQQKLDAYIFYSSGINTFYIVHVSINERLQSL